MSTEPPPERPWRRRPLTQRGGLIELQGDPELAEALRAALEGTEDAPVDDLTHGFHVYPARMHPALARGLLDRFARPGDVVLDPFAGSGTVLVEALAAGCRAQGVDLSPLASRVAEVQCALRDAPARARFTRALEAVAIESEVRVRARAAVTVPIPRHEREYYEPHVMLEMSGLWDEISKVDEVADRRALQVVFSALVVKFSRQRADTSDVQVQKRIRKGLVTEFFLRKGRELALRWEALWEAVPEPRQPARWTTGDARRLPELLGSRFRADLVVCSPPYGGTYDYAKQHARRSAWLRLDMRELTASEIGARRNAIGPLTPGEARARWDQELHDVLCSLEAVTSEDGTILLWLGDAELAGRRLRADDQLLQLAPSAQLSVIAIASQTRMDMRGGSPRQEHLIALHPSR
jgi:hypothetical protein